MAAAANQQAVMNFWVEANQVVGWEGNTSALFGQQSYDDLLPPSVQLSGNRAAATSLAKQVLSGKVTTITTPKDQFTRAGVGIPVEGDMSIICDGDGNPVALVQDSLVQITDSHTRAGRHPVVVEHFTCIYPTKS